jgi:L-ascorbate oxidase
MVCSYNWTLEQYSTLSAACFNCPYNYTDCLRENCILADGIVKTIEVVNKLLPGPSIQVCKGDTIVVNLENRLRSERVTSIHWHGLPQHNTPYMDGVSMITQCPIIPMTSFKYKFKAEPSGTYWWHSHSGFQRSVRF